MTATPHGRIPALDGLRGCAIILVIFFHANVWFGGEFGGEGGVLSIVFGAGWIGVDLFFVLSGFLITRLLLEARSGSGPREYFGDFYRHRILRIFPLYYGFLLVYFALPRAQVFGNDTYSIPAIGVVSLALFFYNFLSAFGHMAIPTLHAFWSLSVEEHFYLFWPFLVWTLPESRLLRLCAVLPVLSLAGRLAAIYWGHSLQIAYLTTPCRLDGLALGALVAVAARRPAIWSKLQKWAWPAGLAAAALFLALGAAQGHFKDNVDFRAPHPPVRGDSSLIVGPGISAAAIFFAAVLIGVLEDRWLARMLEWPPLRSIGKYSYAMYVFHRLLFHISSFYLVRLFPGYEEFPPILGKPLGGLWLLAVSYAAGWASYRFYERHFLALKDKRR